MKTLRFFSLLLAGAMLLGLAGCANTPHKSEIESRFCADNEILTYEPVDFEKTIVTIGLYAPCSLGPIELAIEAEFPRR